MKPFYQITIHKEDKILHCLPYSFSLPMLIKIPYSTYFFQSQTWEYLIPLWKNGIYAYTKRSNERHRLTFTDLCAHACALCNCRFQVLKKTDRRYGRFKSPLLFIISNLAFFLNTAHMCINNFVFWKQTHLSQKFTRL